MSSNRIKQQSHPASGLDGASAMHGDPAASDTTYLSGPGNAAIRSDFIYLNGVCSTVLVRKDGNIIAVCSDFSDQSPMVYLIDHHSNDVLASIRLELGSTLGGIYGFLDAKDQLVMADGARSITWLAVSNKQGVWNFKQKKKRNLSSVILKGEFINAINIDELGAIWFVTDKATVGRYDPKENEMESIKLAENETVHNSFANSGDGKAAIATNKALYILHYDDEVDVFLHAPYDSGSYRKPGKLSNGTGSSPTFFGPVSGTEFVTIADNADDGERVLIYDAHVENPDRALLCSVDVPAYGGVFASENSPIAIGRTVIISSTYGYPYPIDNVLPPSVPSFAPIEGGMHRIDLRNSYKPGKGAKKGNRENCHIQWSNAARSAAVPKLSVSDKLVYTVERLDDEYSFSAIEYSTGETLHSQTLGAGNLFNTLQLAGNVGFQRVFWQGTTGGIVKVSAD